MVHVLVHHKVKDYAQWKEVFDEHAKVRRELGLLKSVMERAGVIGRPEIFFEVEKVEV
ncbi:MAG: hypothetical protein ABSE05_11590 [Syntrophales bacterium]|jgi:hypothetical protein